MEDLKCPVCGQMNPPDAETCYQCGSSLHAPIQSGQLPTKKVTSELEPILPDWLRDAREKSHEQGESNEIGESSGKDSPSLGADADLLAGLASQGRQDEEEDVPDWLAGITGEKSHKKESPEFTGSRRVELGDFGELEPEPSSQLPFEAPKEDLSWLSDLAKPESKEEKPDDLTDWFKQAAAPEPEGNAPEPPVEPVQTPPAGEGSVLDWLESLKAEDAQASSQPAAPSEPLPEPESDKQDWLSTPPPAAPDMPDWLKELSTEPSEPEGSAAPRPPSDESRLADWASGLTAEGSIPGPETPLPALTPADLPDWIKDLRPEAEPSEPSMVEPPTPAEPILPPSEISAGSLDWLRELQEPEPPAPGQELPTPAFEQPASMDWLSQPGNDAVPPVEDAAKLDWLKDVQDTAPAPEENIPTPAFQEPAEPDWFIQASTEVKPPAEPESAPASPLDVELPDWLKNATPESLAAPEMEAELPDWMKTPGTFSETPLAEESGLPEWLSGSNANIPETPAEPSETFSEAPLVEGEPTSLPNWLASLGSLESSSTEKPETPEEPAEAMPALPGETLSSGDLNTLFSNIPDWLSEAAPSSGSESAAAPTPTEPGEPLSPANLPSWVQAMRPVEAAMSSSGAAGEEAAMETQGALAGLRGVLPSLPYLGAANKPKAQSFKLQASEEQQDHGALLEQILESETHPEPMAVAPRLAEQKGLRLGLGLLLLLVLLGVVFAGTTITPLPVGWPAETVSAVQAIESVPAGSQVLVVFDYEPSLAGEMEAAASPLLDHLIVRGHPHLTLLSTSATGSALAERLFAGPLGGLAYQDRLNLGYLPGGLSGVRGFAQNPSLAMPLAENSEPVPSAAQNISEYAAILVITDSIDGGRTWIEQAGPLYSGSAFIVVSSAQAGPMLQAYYHSGQINGLVSGLFDAAVLEQNNAGRPGLARRYWDAYNSGLILAVLLITLGALWNLFAGLRERASGEAQ